MSIDLQINLSTGLGGVMAREDMNIKGVNFYGGLVPVGHNPGLSETATIEYNHGSDPKGYGTLTTVSGGDGVVGGDFSVAVTSKGMTWSAGGGQGLGLFADPSIGYFTGRIPWVDSAIGMLMH